MAAERRPVSSVSDPAFLAMAALVVSATSGKMASAAEGKGPPQYGPGDWETLFDLCCQHRTAPLAFPTARHWPGLPPDMADRMRAVLQEGARSSLAQLSALVSLCRLLDGAGIRFLILKGIPLSVLLYGDPARRSCGDIDLLVAPADFAAAARLLCEQGFAPVPGMPPVTGDPGRDGAIRDLILRRGAILVELHQRLTRTLHRLPLSFDELYTGRQGVMLGGRDMPIPGPAHLALYLFVHGASHGWERLAWLADLATLCRNEETAARLVRQLRELGMERAAGQAFALMRDLLDLSPPPDLSVPARASWLTRRLAAGHVGQGHGSAWLLHNLGKRWRCWRLRRGLAALGHELAADLANPVDQAYFNLPRRLAWLYPLLRPVGFLWRNFLHRP
jgi:hypothetical protein